ncbi:MAG: glutamate racemase, partial [Paludibacteraceae bacterium]|nr:glutamate racemase [Paludibacteraceae bacterium]
MTLSDKPAPIGIFDSGYGGLTILRDIQQRMPDRDFIYLGDNARAPYGSRSFDVVYTFTLQCVQRLFEMGCHLVILACNTASAKALRNIQQNDLPRLDPERRVLGIIRPTVEQVGLTSQTRHIGLVGTTGTVQSKSYPLEFKKLYPDITVTDKACPMWVPLVENNEYNGDGADFFVKKYIDELIKKDEQIDTLILGCTHYPLLIEKIKKYLPERVRIVSQGELIAESLENYL